LRWFWAAGVLVLVGSISMQVNNGVPKTANPMLRSPLVLA
jgi:hypothetical protein